MNLTKPKKLSPGDTIGIISPSAGGAGCFPHRVSQARAELERLGFKTRLATNALQTLSYVSASPRDRAADLHELFRDPEVKAIIAATGGNHSNQMLKYLDFELIKKNPKIFLGYSDNTILHFALASQAGLLSFYGPCLITQFGENPNVLKYTEEYLLKALTTTEPIGKVLPSDSYTAEFLDWVLKKDLERPRQLSPSDGYHWWKQGQSEAEIFGGAIPSINHLMGSKYWVDLKDKILFLDHPEGEAPGIGYSLDWFDSFLADLDNLNVFAQIKGLIIGRAYNLAESEIQQLKKIVMYYIQNYDYPVLYNVNIGHVDPIMTLPLGVKVLLDSSKNLFQIVESGVS